MGQDIPVRLKKESFPYLILFFRSKGIPCLCIVLLMWVQLVIQQFSLVYQEQEKQLYPLILKEGLLETTSMVGVEIRFSTLKEGVMPNVWILQKRKSLRFSKQSNLDPYWRIPIISLEQER
ncbi:hypothetical protein D3C85_1076600 [compost metagenome]